MWLIIIIIPLIIAWWVATDARKRGYSKSATLVWFLGVWLALIVFLPLYLILRPKTPRQGKLRGGTRVCPYCGKLYQGDISYCPYCGQRLDEEL
jgi:hypothetical protein